MKVIILKTLAIILLCVPVSQSAITLHENNFQHTTNQSQLTFNTSVPTHNISEQPLLPGSQELPELKLIEESTPSSPTLEPNTPNTEPQTPNSNPSTPEPEQQEQDTELETLLNTTKSILQIIINDEVNSLLYADGYFSDGELIITAIPKSMREEYKNALDTLTSVINSTPNIMESIEEDSFNINNEFLTAYYNFDYYLGECAFN